MCHAGELHELAEASRELIRIYAEKLNTEYDDVIRKGNNAGLARVCRSKAHEIASGLSRDGWSIRRTSLYPLGDANSPDAFERRILQDFEERRKEGRAIDHLSYYRMAEAENESVFHYLKAIPARDYCLSCHGSSLPADTYTGTTRSPPVNPDSAEPEVMIGAYSVRYKAFKSYFGETESESEPFALPEYRESPD